MTTLFTGLFSLDVTTFPDRENYHAFDIVQTLFQNRHSLDAGTPPIHQNLNSLDIGTFPVHENLNSLDIVGTRRLGPAKSHPTKVISFRWG